MENNREKNIEISIVAILLNILLNIQIYKYFRNNRVKKKLVFIYYYSCKNISNFLNYYHFELLSFLQRFSMFKEEEEEINNVL